MNERDGSTRTVDVLAYRDGDERTYRLVPSGTGEEVVAAHEAERRRRRLLRGVIGAVIALVVVGYGIVVGNIVLGVFAAGIVAVAFWYGERDDEQPVPTVVDRNMYPRNAADRYDLGEGAVGSAGGPAGEGTDGTTLQ